MLQTPAITNHFIAGPACSLSPCGARLRTRPQGGRVGDASLIETARRAGEAKVIPDLPRKDRTLLNQFVYEIGTASCPRYRLSSTLKRGSKNLSLQLSVWILKAGAWQVKFKLFMAGIIEFWRKTSAQREPCGPERHSFSPETMRKIGTQREELLTTSLRMMASAISFMGLRRCWLCRCRIR